MDKMKLLDFLETLRDGINTHTGEVCQDKAFFEDDALQKNFDRIIQYIRNSNVVQHKPIEICREKLNNIQPDFKTITISTFAEKLKHTTSSKNASTISKAVQSYLLFHGYLYVKENQKTKYATEKGEDIGLQNILQSTYSGKQFSCVSYTPRAQEFVIEHLPEIIDFFNKHR